METTGLSNLNRPEAKRLLRFASQLSADERAELERQIAGIDFDLLARLHRQSKEPAAKIDASQIQPISVVELPTTAVQHREWEEADRLGREAMAAGRCGVLLVAGGQGSRLGFEAPKGMFPIGPVRNTSLFETFATRIKERSRQAGKRIPWYIMTSPTNRAQTQQYFASNKYFGLPPEDVMFFIQGVMPAVSRDTGEVLLASPKEVFTSPNGHGGTLLALEREGVLADMAKRGVDLVYYFQVDNPLVKLLEPAFLGLHLKHRADFSAKVVRKIDPKEKVGLVVEYDGKPTVIEYSDLPDELAVERAPGGGLKYWPGSIAIHVFSRPFLERVADALPYHIAHKAVPHLDDSGSMVTPSDANAVKFEMFIFDSMPMAERVAIVETDREDEFAPVKNAKGADSPESVRAAMVRQAGRWLQAAGIEFPKAADGSPATPVEILGSAGLDPADFAEKQRGRPPIDKPTIFEEAYRSQPH
jgi:UDP-N-acetylglucosamine/UDP-N-acetylgalactosamine diphosphorylase